MFKYLSYLPEALIREVEEGRAAVVGGAVRSQFDGTQLKDVDVFVFCQENYRHLVQMLGAQEVPGTEGHVHTVPGREVSIELVFEVGHSSAQACVDHADFDIASGVYCGGQFMYCAGFLEATKNKTMRFLRTQDPQRSYSRFIRFNRKYGYRIDSSIRELLRIWKNS